MMRSDIITDRDIKIPLAISSIFCQVFNDLFLFFVNIASRSLSDRVAVCFGEIEGPGVPAVDDPTPLEGALLTGLFAFGLGRGRGRGRLGAASAMS